MNVIKFESNNCKKIREYLDYYINNELLVETSHEVIKHLENCESCSEELKARQQMKGLLQRAVRRQTASPRLQARIRNSLRRAPASRQAAWIAAIAATVVMALGVWGALRLWNSRSVETAPPVARLSNASILKIGLGNHVHCALDMGLKNSAFTDEEMTAKLGQFSGLVTLVREKVSGGYRIVVGHHCKHRGREFTHLILRKNDAILSLTITGKDGESFSQSDALDVIEASGVSLHQSLINDLEIAGFETRDYLAFVVSNLPREANSSIASRLAPAVREYLARLET